MPTTGSSASRPAFTASYSASAFRRRFPYLRGAVTDLNDLEVVEIFRWIFEDDPQQAAVERRWQTYENMAGAT